MADFSPGAVLAERFELLRRLGTGGLAEVFAARDRVTGEEVAVKVLHGHLARDADIAERFRREMAVTRGLDHPGIVRVYDLHEGAGRPFFTMELLRGETLSERLKRGRLHPDEARRIAREACAALHVAHRKGVVHRDLKPANIFLCDSGAVKLVDFGLARVAGWARLTAQSTVMGTPGYIAPELLGGSGADARADIYSLGATLYEMLTGRHAFPGSDPYQVLRRQREGAPSPAAVAPEVSFADDALVRRALDPDPERRFLDMGQLLRELAGEPVPAAPAAPPSMTAGNFDVVLHHTVFQGTALKRVFRALGIKVRFGWKGRMQLVGTNLLASGASRSTAEALAAVCQEQGVGAALVPHQKVGPVRRWLGRNAARVAAVLGAAGGVFVDWKFLSQFLHPARGEPMKVFSQPAGQILGLTYFLTATFILTGGATFFASWLMLGLSAGPPIDALPEGDPSVRRLMDGIVRRVKMIRQTQRAAPPATQMILGDLIDACEKLQEVAAALAERAAVIEDPLGGPEAKTIPPGEAAARDEALERLLEMASALDDALAVASSDNATRASGLLERLREETQWAQGALPGPAQGVEGPAETAAGEAPQGEPGKASARVAARNG